MAKRKVTVTVDEELVELVQELGAESLSSVVNAALAAEVDRMARAAAHGPMLQEWDEAIGPVDAAAAETARTAFDDLDAVSVESAPRPVRRRRRAGAA
jgi:hypothetical protein